MPTNLELMDQVVEEGLIGRLLEEIDSSERVWKTMDGRVIPINDITDDHLVNIVHYLHRKKVIPFSLFLMKYFSFGSERYKYTFMKENGEKVSLDEMKTFIAKARSLEKQRYSYHYDWILEEIKNRGLSRDVQDVIDSFKG